MEMTNDISALQQQTLPLTQALAKQTEESEKQQTELHVVKQTVVEITKKDETHKSVPTITLTSLTNSTMRSMLQEARSALSVAMLELEDSAKHMAILVQKNKILVAENDDLKQELESLSIHRLTTTDLKNKQVKSRNEESSPKQEEKEMKDDCDYASDNHPRKYVADEDLNVLRDELKTCKADNEQLLALISNLTAEGKSRKSVKQEALLLQNLLQAERLRYQEMKDSFQKLQTSTENVMKEAAQAAVSDDRLKRMGELENEKLWKLIASLKYDTEKRRNVLPDSFSEVSATICERDNVSEEMKNVCNQLIAAKEENKRLQDIVDNLRRSIDTLQNKLAETNTENDNLIMQNLSSSSGNEELKGQADHLSSRLKKFVADYPKQMRDTDTIKELAKELRCLHEKFVVNITTCNIEAIKEENLRLENLLRERETEIAGMRVILSEKGIPVPAHLELPIDIIKEPRETDGGQTTVSSYDDTGKKLLSHLAAENVLLKKHLERRAKYTPEIISQLEEENELLKRQLSSETHIIECVRKDNIQFQQKSIDETKAPQQQTVDKIGAMDITQQRRTISVAGKTTENALRDQIESLQKQVDDANGVTRSLETAIDELRNTRASLLVTGITEVAPQRGICCKCGKSKRKTENEKDLIGISAEIVETENDKIMRNRIELLERQLSDANSIVKSLEEATSTAETENERNLHNKIEELQSQLNDTNNIVKSLGKMLDEVQNEYKALQVTGVSEVTQEIPGTSTAETDHERILINQVELLRKQLNDANNMVISLESTLNELRDENESMQLPVITEVAQQSRGMPAAEPENEKMRNQIESLQKQLNDSNAMIQELQDRVKKLTDENNVLKSMKTKDEVTTSATIKEAGGSPPSSTDPESEKVMKQLTADNESLRKELEEARKYVHKTSDDETKHENIITELKAENELLKKKIEDAREKQSRKYIEDPGSTKIINQMTKENELLRKQVEDLRRAQPRPSSAGTSRDPAFEQLMKDYEAVRERLEDARKNLPVPVTSEPQEATESEDIVKLRTDNEILRKQLEDAWKMAQSTQEQILGDDYTKIIDQLREENEFLKKRLESLTDITSVSSKEVVKYVEKPVEIIKADTDTEKTITELRNLIESLQSELKDANTAKRELEEQIKKLKEEKQLEPVEIIKADTDTEKTITELRNLNESLQSELKDANTAKRELEEQIKKLKEEKQLEPEKSTKTDEKTLDKDISQLTEQNELLKKQLQDATNTIEDLTKNIDKLKDEIQRLQSTKISGVEDHTQELQKLEAELQELRDENNRLKRENEKIRQDVTNLTQTAVPSALILWKTDEQQLESTVDEQKRRIEDLLSKMSKKDHPGDPGEVETWKKERERLLDMINQLRQELKESQEALEEKDEMDARMQSLLSQIAEMKQKLEEQEKELAMGGGAAQDLQEENTKMKNQMESLNSELENMKQKLKDQEAELGRLTQLQDENTKLKNELDSLKEELERLRAAGQAAEQVQGLTDENEKLKKELDSLKEELERLRAAGQAAEQVQGLTDENERLKKELEALKQDMSKLQSAEQAAEQAKSALEENQKLKDENDKLQKELEALRAELDKLKSAQQADQSLLDEINKLKGENEKLKSELEEKVEQMKKLESEAKEAGGKDLSKELEALQEQLKQLQAEKQKLENELKECLEKNKTMEDKIKSLESADAAMKALQDELEALKAENKKLAEGGGGAPDAKKLKELEDECEAKLAALRAEHQKELERRDQVHRENLETCQMELNELKKKLQESDKTLQLNLDKDKNKAEDAKEYEDEIARLQKQSEMLAKNLKADLEAKNAELDKLRFEMTKENNDLKKQLEKCMADCEKYKKELEKMSGAPVKAVSSKKSTARVDKTKSEPLPTVKEEKSEKKDKEKKDKEKKEKKDKEKKDKEKKEKKPKEESDEAPATDKVPKKAEGAAKKKGGPASKGDGKPDTTSKSKLEESVPEGGKKGDGGVCRCMEHPLVKIIYKILHGGTEVLSTEDIVYLHKKLCAECRTALGPPRNEAQVRAHMRMLRKEIVEREEKMNKEVAQLEESLHEGKLFLERLYERYTEKRKAAQEAIQTKKMAPTHPQACSARRTASGTAIGSRNQPWMAPSNRPADQTGVAKMTVRCPG